MCMFGLIHLTIGDHWMEILSSKSIRYRLLLCCIIQFSQQLVGIQIITTFGYDILSILGMHSVGLGLSLAYISSLFGVVLGA